MSIDRLGSTAALIAALRAEISRKPERGGSRDAAPARAGKSEAGQKTRDPDVLRRELAKLVEGVNPDDQQALDALRPRLIRSVLLWEFGSELREYSEWQPMLERITRTLEANAEHRADLARVVRDLQR